MAFLETPRFPELISYHAVGGPAYLTTVVQVESGSEYRDQAWTQALSKYDVSHAARTKAYSDQIVAFFRIARGRTNGFRFKDWADFEDKGGGIFVMLTSTTFQMYKRYTSGSSTEDRKITKPVSPVVVTGGSSPSVNYTTGVVTVSSGTPTSWTGTFDVPCRFDTDDLKGEILDSSGGIFVMGYQSIPIVELRL